MILVLLPITSKDCFYPKAFLIKSSAQPLRLANGITV